MHKISQIAMRVIRYVRGKKTYLTVCSAGFTEVFYSFGYLSLEQRDALLKLFAGGAILAFAAKINRAVTDLKSVRNILERGKS